MSETRNGEEQHRRPHAQPMAASYLEFDLARELEQLHNEPDWKAGHNARTLVKHDDVRVVLIALKAQARIPEHKTDGRISIQTVQGGRSTWRPAGSSCSTGRSGTTWRRSRTARFS
jgi:hypothetical protein